MRKLSLIPILCLVTSWLALSVSAQSYSELVFSGFVEVPSTASYDEPIDFSNVQIQLFTDDNKFIDSTHCSSNGFFLLPIYDKKSYVVTVKPPQESTFDPQSISVNLRGKTNEEVAQITEQSLIFKFLGFSLTGQAQIRGATHGAVGVKVALYDAKNQRVGEATTTEGGNFKFDRVMTGKYTVQLETKDSGFYYHDGEGSMTCELSWKRGQECTGKLVISSFEVRGSVSNQNNILGKHVIFLYSDNPNLKGRGNLPPIREHPLAGSNQDYISYSRIDREGNFRFESVPRGNYHLKIHTSDRENKIEIEPDTFNFVVEDAPAVIENPFSINRFSVKGRVVDKEGNGVREIKIILDGEKKAITDNDGYYYIDRVPVGTYTLEGSHDHLFFEPISNMKLEPTMTTLPDLTLSMIHLCGEVSLKDGINDNEFSGAKITVYLEKQGEKRSTIPESNGHYCFEVQPGRYNVYPVISNIGNIKQETLLHPKIREVQLTNAPILDVNFYRPRLFINGSVQFLPNVKPSQMAKTRIVLTSTNNKGSQRTVSLAENINRFAFDQILPGSYKLYIENDHLCWKNDLQVIDLINSNITDLTFEQAGFAFKYHTSRALEVRIISPTGKPVDTQLLPSSSSYCVDSAGTYTIVPDVCYQFATSEFNVSTDDANGLSLDPIGFLVRGEVIANESLGQNIQDVNLAQFITENILISIQTETSNPPKKNFIRLQYSSTENNYLKFSYAYYVEPNSDITIEARPRPKLQPKAEQIIQNLMFNPTKLQLHVGENCVLDTKETQIEIRQGLIFVGSVQPPVTDWVLNVRHLGEPPAGEDSQIESRQMNTSQFKLGPYIDFLQYEITAEKEGYKFEPTITEQGYNLFRVTFAAQKLSQLRIHVLDQERKPVPGALLFVSSMAKKNFLKVSNYTNERGVFSTHQLVKGDYFIRAVLKEYNFDPPQTTITIDDGEHKEINIIAKRVAYSAYGRVQKLNRAGCAGLKVQAVPQEGLVPTETAETDQHGDYRIKGLVPGTTYTISIEKSTQYSIIKPEKFVIEAQANDLKDIDFLAFERKASHTIAGNVIFDSTYTEEDLDQIEAIQVRLYRPGQEGHEEPLDTANLRLFRYFEFKNVQAQDYTIKVLIKRGKNQLPSEHTQHVSADSFGENPYAPGDVLISREKAQHVEHSSKGSVVAPIVFLIIIFLVLNIDAISSKFRKYLERKEQPSNLNKKRA